MSSDNSMGDSPRGAQDTAQPSTRDYMLAAKRWVVWSPDKQPFYIDSTPRRGTLDSDEDRAKLASYQEACTAVQASNGRFAGIGFALGPDGAGGYWQGVDLDNVKANELDDIADTAPGHVELSPSGNGCHAIGYGAYFPALGSNGTGVEAYAAGRYFTYTGAVIRGGALVCLSPWVQGPVAARHGAARPTASAAGGAVYVDPKTVSELRSALRHLRADDYDIWYRMGLALKELGETGRGLWLDWSSTSDKFDAMQAARKWDQLGTPRDTGYQAVFAEAQRHGWINPASTGAQIALTPIANFVFRFARKGDAAVEVTYLVDPWLQHRTVIGCWGRGEAGKSSWCAQMAAWASPVVSTLWITSEEPESHIRVRHNACGGEDGTLAVNVAVPTELDPKTGKAVATSFNVYEHLEPAIEAFKRSAETRQDRPLGLIVLDAVVALTTWPKGANANDDEGVKKLIAFLLSIAARHNLTILILGHLNKKTTREHVADAVTGAVAWTSSTRLSFMFVKDPDEEFQGFIRTVKKNTGQHYGASYKTVPVHRVTVRTNGNDEWLCGVEMGETVWGEKALREEMGDDEHLNRREEKEAKVQEIIGRTLEALHANGVTNRKAVAMTLDYKPHRRYWKDADKVLASKHSVQIEKIEHGEYIYRLPTEPLPKPLAPISPSTLDNQVSRILEKVLSAIDKHGQLNSESFMNVVREVYGSHPSDIIVANLYRAMRAAGIVRQDGSYIRA